MSLFTVEVPSMGESVKQAVVAKLLVAQGQWAKKGSELIELETDKVNQILYAAIEGRIDWSVKVGQQVIIGQKLAQIDPTAEKSSSSDVNSTLPKAQSTTSKLASSSSASESKAAKPNEKAKKASQNLSNVLKNKIGNQALNKVFPRRPVQERETCLVEEERNLKALSVPVFADSVSVAPVLADPVLADSVPAAPVLADPVLAALPPLASTAPDLSLPAVSVLALAEKGFEQEPELSSKTIASKPKGRLTNEEYLSSLDLRQEYTEERPEDRLEKSSEKSTEERIDLSKELRKLPPSEANAPLPPLKKVIKEQRNRLSQLRRTIGERLVQAKNQAAILTTFNEVDMSSVLAIRERNQEAFQQRHGIKWGLTSFFVQATVYALKKVPVLNAYIDGDEWVQRLDYHLAIAVSTDRGLLVPVIQDCDQLSMAEIEKEIVRLSTRARDSRITLEELSGASFTITNGGVFGSLLSTPLINPPQSGILALHKIQKRVIVDADDQILVRPMMYIALSYDHRLVDGKEAVTFLLAIKEAIEQPERLWLNL